MDGNQNKDLADVVEPGKDLPEKVYPYPKRSIPEPTRVADGEEFNDDFATGTKRPKWMIAKGSVQKMILDAVGKTYFADHNERSAVIAIEKASMYLNTGVISTYPTEWVEQCVEWAKKKRRERMPVGFSALINLINNADRKTVFVAEWAKKNPEQKLRKDAAVRKMDEEEPNDISHLTE